jgi:hypothetical protein
MREHVDFDNGDAFTIGSLSMYAGNGLVAGKLHVSEARYICIASSSSLTTFQLIDADADGDAAIRRDRQNSNNITIKP